MQTNIYVYWVAVFSSFFPLLMVKWICVCVCVCVFHDKDESATSGQLRMFSASYCSLDN